jgi:hypothetical protein
MSKREKLWVLLGILLFVLLNYPILHIFNREILVGGLPILPLYLFVVYTLAIAGLYGFVRRLTFKGKKGREKS